MVTISDQNYFGPNLLSFFSTQKENFYTDTLCLSMLGPAFLDPAPDYSKDVTNESLIR